MSDHDLPSQPSTDRSDLDAELVELGMTEDDLDAALESDQEDLALAELWEPDQGMVTRVTTRVQHRIADREALSAIAELGGLGWFTIKALFEDHNEP